MPDFVNRINHSLLIWCLLCVVCCKVGNKETRRGPVLKEFIFEVDFYNSPTVSFVFLMPPSLKNDSNYRLFLQ